jgi:peptide/nickel transport system substrate-binding protein
MNPRFARTTAVVAGGLCVTLIAAACSGGTGTSGGTANRTLNVVALTPPDHIDPALAGIYAEGEWYTPLAYDSLIHQGPKGTLQPALATSWKYVGTGNREFQLTLRQGAQFADGTAVTAAAVVKSLQYSLIDSKGPQTSFIGKVTSVTAPDAKTIDIKLADPNPEMPFVLSSNTHLGAIISPKGLADVAALGHSTAGAGPYVLDQAATVSGDHYTYRRNPNYWNKAAGHYDKIVIKVVSQPNAALALLKTGAADVVHGDVNTADSAKSAGFTVNSALVAETGIAIFDHTGELVKPLGNQLVRQALNYAVDRKTIADSLVHGYGKPVNQPGAPGTPDYLESAAGQYSYDPAKAKALLAQAGYPGGFSARLVMFTGNPPSSDVAQAVISDWAKIGVKINATTDSDGAKYVADAQSKKYPLISYGYGYIPFFLYSKNFYLPADGAASVVGSGDPKLTSLVQQGNAQSDAAQRPLYDQATQRGLDLAWFVPVTSYSVLYFTSHKVANADIDSARPLLDLTELTPAK